MIEDSIDPLAELEPDREVSDAEDSDSTVVLQAIKDVVRTAERRTKGAISRGKNTTHPFRYPDVWPGIETFEGLLVIEPFDARPLNFAYPCSASDATATVGSSAPTDRG